MHNIYPDLSCFLHVTNLHTLRKRVLCFVPTLSVRSWVRCFISCPWKLWIRATALFKNLREAESSQNSSRLVKETDVSVSYSERSATEWCLGPNEISFVQVWRIKGCIYSVFILLSSACSAHRSRLCLTKFWLRNQTISIIYTQLIVKTEKVLVLSF